MSHLKLALRTLSKTPLITAVAILSLALGIGANAAIYSLFDQVLLASLPVHEPERLVNLVAPGPKPGSQSCNDAGGCDAVFSYAMFRDLEREGAGFEGLAGHRLFGANVATADQTLSSTGMLVSGSYFGVLGVQAERGRLLGISDDETLGAHPVAVLSHGFWENELGADPSVLNQTLVVNGHPLTVVGIAPRGFRGTTLSSDPDIFVPLTMRAEMESWFDVAGFDNRRSYWLYVFGRLRPGSSLEQTTAEANTLYQSIVNEVEAPLQDGMSASTLERFLTKPLLIEEGHQGQSHMQDDARTPLTLLLSITAFVLIIACANIANLLLARGAKRGQEMAIRGSLGARRSQLLGQLMVESLLLAAVGGVVSLVVAYWTLGAIGIVFPPEYAQVLELSLRPKVVFFSGLLAVGTGFLFGLYPALHSTRPDLITALRSASGQQGGSRAAARFRNALVTGQIALSLTLLVGAGLFIKSLLNVSRVDLGLNTENIVTFGVSPSLNGYDNDRSMELFARLEEELTAIPGVTSVAASLVPALSGNSWGNSVSVQGFHREADTDANSRFNAVGPGYFATMDIPLLAGRDFTDSDVEGAPEVAIVNEAFARKFGLDPASAVGSFMAVGGIDDELNIEIVGLVRDAKYAEVKQEVPPLYFRPYRQDDNPGFLNFYLSAGVDPDGIMRAVPAVMKGLDPNLPVEDIKTLEQQVAETVVLDRLISILAAAFATLATLLAAVGLYGVLAYTVAQRTREIGLRMALGAGADNVRGLVLRQVTRMTALGGIIGIAMALAMGRAAQSLLFELEGHDPWVVAGVVAVVAVVTYTAGYLPALRASKVDPMEALRYE